MVPGGAERERDAKVKISREGKGAERARRIQSGEGPRKEKETKAIRSSSSLVTAAD